MRLAGSIIAATLAVSLSATPVLAQSVTPAPSNEEDAAGGLAGSPLSSIEGGDVLTATLVIGGGIVIAGIAFALLDGDSDNTVSTNSSSTTN
ncbi:hypothetical protein KHP62_00585 [Rhodobacteraceae bacterium NNCM2]|nr:hypothetical protein [Coraliihabitans acroporae]